MSNFDQVQTVKNFILRGLNASQNRISERERVFNAESNKLTLAATWKGTECHKQRATRTGTPAQSSLCQARNYIIRNFSPYRVCVCACVRVCVCVPIVTIFNLKVLKCCYHDCADILIPLFDNLRSGNGFVFQFFLIERSCLRPKNQISDEIHPNRSPQRPTIAGVIPRFCCNGSSKKYFYFITIEKKNADLR